MRCEESGVGTVVAASTSGAAPLGCDGGGGAAVALLLFSSLGLGVSSVDDGAKGAIINCEEADDDDDDDVELSASNKYFL